MNEQLLKTSGADILSSRTKFSITSWLKFRNITDIRVLYAGRPASPPFKWESPWEQYTLTRQIKLTEVLVSKLVKATFICLRKLRYLFFQPITCKFCKSKGIFCISQPNARKYNIGTRISQSAQRRCDSVPKTSRQLMAVFR